MYNFQLISKILTIGETYIFKISISKFYSYQTQTFASAKVSAKYDMVGQNRLIDIRRGLLGWVIVNMITTSFILNFIHLREKICRK